MSPPIAAKMQQVISIGEPGCTEKTYLIKKKMKASCNLNFYIKFLFFSLTLKQNQIKIQKKRQCISSLAFIVVYFAALLKNIVLF